MTDERYVFVTDVAEKKRTASGARHVSGKTNRKGCRLPSDNLTSTQKKKLNGPVKEYSMREPWSWKQLSSAPESIQQAYIEGLRMEYGCSNKQLCELLGCAPSTFWRHFPTHREARGMMPEFSREKWEKFICGEQDVQETVVAKEEEDTPEGVVPEEFGTYALSVTCSGKITADGVYNTIKSVLAGCEGKFGSTTVSVSTGCVDK